MYWSIVCPTMWRSKGLQHMIEDQKILDNPDVEELLIIDNDPSKTIEFNHPKVRVIYRGQNIFVNPAWNYGVRCATTPNICLLSDDIVFDPSVFSQLRTNPRVGIIGLGEGCDVGPAGSITPKKVLVHRCMPYYSNYEQQFGMFMLFHKAAYLPIPEEAKVFLGDLWIFDWNLKRGANNYFINNFDVVMQRGATSMSNDLIGIGGNDLKNRQYIFETYFPK